MDQDVIQIKGTILKIKDIEVNNDSGFTKRVISFQPKHGKVFYPEFHYRRMKLLNGFEDGDEVILSIKIFGSENETRITNNIVADGIRKLQLQ